MAAHSHRINRVEKLRSYFTPLNVAKLWRTKVRTRSHLRRHLTEPAEGCLYNRLPVSVRIEHSPSPLPAVSPHPNPIKREILRGAVRDTDDAQAKAGLPYVEAVHGRYPVSVPLPSM